MKLKWEWSEFPKICRGFCLLCGATCYIKVGLVDFKSWPIISTISENYIMSDNNDYENFSLVWTYSSSETEGFKVFSPIVPRLKSDEFSFKLINLAYVSTHNPNLRIII